MASTNALETDNFFHWADYLVFAVVLAISASIGIYYGIKGRKGETKEDFLLAGRQMSLLPVSISLMVSWLSAVSMLGDPTEVYNYGIGYWFVAVGYFVAPLFAAFFFAPTFYRAGNISAYELLNQKYGVHMRTFGSVIMGTKMMLYMGVALYAPCIAVSQMTGLKIEICIVIIGGICTFYTSLGGIKAVLWADTVQTVIMVGGLLAVLIQGMITVGGPSEVFRLAGEGGRTTLNLDFNPLARTSIWWYMIGGFFNIFGPYISSQMIIQRYCTLKSEADMKKAVALNSPFLGLFASMFALLGLTIYAYFRNCDPLTAGRISRPDQLMPLMVLDTLGHLHGMSGLFLSCVCSAALSTLSSGLSGIVATCLEDIIQPLYRRQTGRNIGSKKAKVVAVGLSIGFGALHIGLAFINLLLKDTTIFDFVNRISGALTGPMAGIFVVCIHIPWVDSISTVIGVCGGTIISLWFAIGSLVDPPLNLINSKLPVSTAGCQAVNVTDMPGGYVTAPVYTTSVYPESNNFSLNDLYGLSPMSFSPLGFAVAILLSVVAGGISKCFRRKNGSWNPSEKGEKNLKKVDGKFADQTISSITLPEPVKKQENSTNTLEFGIM